LKYLTEAWIEWAAYLEFVISATAFRWCSFRSNMLLIDATMSEMMKAPQSALIIEINRPKGETATTSPYPTVVIVIITHQMEVE